MDSTPTPYPPQPEPSRKSDTDAFDAPSQYPEPLIIEPTGEHKQSWIILHGRGDHARSFAQGALGFLKLPLPDDLTIQEHLPNVRFVFPTAKPRRARVLKRAMVTQWFDCYSWDTNEKAHWEIEGLRESSQWVHKLMREEINAVGAENVVLGGLSQGCATSLISLLLWEGEPIRCVFGMSGWLPMRHIVEGYVNISQEVKDEDMEGNDLFERDESKVEDANEFRDAVEALCGELEVPVVKYSSAKKIPILLAHGGSDGTVDIERGREAKKCLEALGLNMAWKEYPDLFHWMRGDELQDVMSFVETQHRSPLA